MSKSPSESDLHTKIDVAATATYTNQKCMTRSEVMCTYGCNSVEMVEIEAVMMVREKQQLEARQKEVTHHLPMGTVNFCCGYISKGRLLREGILAHNVVLYLVLLNLTNNPAPPRFVVNVIVSTPTSSTCMKSDTIQDISKRQCWMSLLFSLRQLLMTMQSGQFKQLPGLRVM